MHRDLRRHKYNQSGVVECGVSDSAGACRISTHVKLRHCLERAMCGKRKNNILYSYASTGHLAGSFLRSRKWITAADVNTWDSECDAGIRGTALHTYLTTLKALAIRVFFVAFFACLELKWFTLDAACQSATSRFPKAAFA